MLAGRSLPMMLSAAALFATWFGSETVFGASSEFLKGGFLHVIEDPFGAALCLILFGLFYARKLYNLNLLTLGDYFTVRFGKKVGLIASIFLVPPYVGYIAAQLVAMGLILNVVTGLEIWMGVTVSAAIVTLYTYIGGMWAISITDFIQSIIIISGLIAISIILAGEAGGVMTVLNEVPKETYRILPAFEWTEWAAYLAAWSVIGLGSISSQDVYQRVMSSRSAKVAVRSCWIAGIMYLTVAMLPLFIGLCAKHLYPDQNTGDAQLALPNMVLEHTALPLQVLFFGSLLSAIMSTTSSAILAPASVFSENIIKPLFRNVLEDHQFLKITRLSVLLFGVLATIMATMRTNIYELVGESSILSLVSLFVPLTFGLYWSRSNPLGATLAMSIGLLGWVIFEYLFPLSIPSLIPATLLSILGMVAGSLFLPNTKLLDDKD
jgi:SSS family transporter